MSRPSTRSLALLLAASTLAGALQTPSALLAHVQAACTASGPPVCIIDGNNLRGAEALEQSVAMTTPQLGSCASSGRRPTGRPATASGARASRLQKPAAHVTAFDQSGAEYLRLG